MNGMVFRKAITLITLAAFLLTGVVPAHAQVAMMPAPGTRTELSAAFEPPVLRGVKVYANEPMRFDFILDEGSRAGRSSNAETQNIASPRTAGRSVEAQDLAPLRNDPSRLIKYFMAAMTVPENDLWVNLSPYEKDRIVPDAFGQTEMGRDLLAQDYLLKQITASVIYPEGETGKKFWAEVYKKAQEKYGTTDIPMDTFNKVWIVPSKAVVYERSSQPNAGEDHVSQPNVAELVSARHNGDNNDSAVAYINEARLKVMLETDYLASQQGDPAGNVGAGSPRPENEIAKQVLRDIVIPLLEKEVNEGANFAPLRQVYYSLILAAWYKKKIKDSLLAKAYVDRNKITGVNISDPKEAEKIWGQYVEAFKKGIGGGIREETDIFTGEILPRKYFSGGMDINPSQKIEVRKVDPGFMAEIKEAARVLRHVVCRMDLLKAAAKSLGREMVRPAKRVFVGGTLAYLMLQGGLVYYQYYLGLHDPYGDIRREAKNLNGTAPNSFTEINIGADQENGGVDELTAGITAILAKEKNDVRQQAPDVARKVVFLSRLNPARAVALWRDFSRVTGDRLMRLKTEQKAGRLDTELSTKYQLCLSVLGTELKNNKALQSYLLKVLFGDDEVARQAALDFVLDTAVSSQNTLNQFYNALSDELYRQITAGEYTSSMDPLLRLLGDKLKRGSFVDFYFGKFPFFTGARAGWKKTVNAYLHWQLNDCLGSLKGRLPLTEDEAGYVAWGFRDATFVEGTISLRPLVANAAFSFTIDNNLDDARYIAESAWHEFGHRVLTAHRGRTFSLSTGEFFAYLTEYVMTGDRDGFSVGNDALFGHAPAERQLTEIDRVLTMYFHDKVDWVPVWKAARTLTLNGGTIDEESFVRGLFAAEGLVPELQKEGDTFKVISLQPVAADGTSTGPVMATPRPVRAGTDARGNPAQIDDAAMVLTASDYDSYANMPIPDEIRPVLEHLNTVGTPVDLYWPDKVNNALIFLDEYLKRGAGASSAAAARWMEEYLGLFFPKGVETSAVLNDLEKAKLLLRNRKLIVSYVVFRTMMMGDAEEQFNVMQKLLFFNQPQQFEAVRARAAEVMNQLAYNFGIDENVARSLLARIVFFVHAQGKSAGVPAPHSGVILIGPRLEATEKAEVFTRNHALSGDFIKYEKQLIKMHADERRQQFAGLGLKEQMQAAFDVLKEKLLSQSSTGTAYNNKTGLFLISLEEGAFSDEVLTFVLAAELGHILHYEYINRMNESFRHVSRDRTSSSTVQEVFDALSRRIVATQVLSIGWNRRIGEMLFRQYLRTGLEAGPFDVGSLAYAIMQTQSEVMSWMPNKGRTPEEEARRIGQDRQAFSHQVSEVLVDKMLLAAGGDLSTTALTVGLMLKEGIGIDHGDHVQFFEDYLTTLRTRAPEIEQARQKRFSLSLSGNGDPAQKGGIDLTAKRMNVETKNDGAGMAFNIDPAQLQAIIDAPGLRPVITRVTVLNDLAGFIGS